MGIYDDCGFFPVTESEFGDSYSTDSSYDPEPEKPKTPHFADPNYPIDPDHIGGANTDESTPDDSEVDDDSIPFDITETSDDAKLF